MIFTIFIAFISIIGLLVLHEFGHFIIAKKFGVRVDEFGIGYPPRLYGKKIGETLYSLNLLPFGAFVRIPGEIEKIEDERSFSSQSLWKRALIVAGGVLSFWIMAAVIFSIVFAFGTQVAVSDEEANLKDAKVQVLAINPGSPAKEAGLEPGDIIKQLTINPEKKSGISDGAGIQQLTINKVKEVQELTGEYKGQEMILTIQRGKDIFDVKLTPRVSPPKGEGPMGVTLARTALKSYSWYEAPWRGIRATVSMTGAIVQGYSQAINKMLSKQPSGVELVGPVGVFQLLTQASRLGVSNFLQFIGMLAIYMAIFNILPIPAVDGGKLLFLGIEAVRRKPVSEKTEQSITTFCFMLLLVLMVLVTIKDIIRIF